MITVLKQSPFQFGVPLNNNTTLIKKKSYPVRFQHLPITKRSKRK